MEEPILGCELVPDDPRNYPYHLIEQVGASEVPDFRIELPESYQGNKPSCVGHAVGKSKSKQDSNEAGKLIDLNKMILYSLCKREENFVGWGTNVPLAMKMLANYGIPLATTIPEDTTIPEEEYIRTCLKMTPEQWLEASKYKAKSYFVVYAGDWERIIRTCYTEKIPLVTTMMWYKSYNQTEVDGRLPLPDNNKAGGHAFVLSEKETVNGRERWWFDNSWGKSWGKNGRFYIWRDELEKYNLGTFFVIVDLPREVADILVKYQGKVVKNANNPTCYLIDKKRVINIGDEKTFNIGKDLTRSLWGDWTSIVTIPEKIVETNKILIS